MQKLASVLGIFASLALAAVAAAQEPIVPPDAKLELLYTRTAAIHGGLTEGPAAAPDGSIYFTDIPLGADKGLIVRFDPATGMNSVFTADSFKANGLAFDLQGNLVACRTLAATPLRLGEGTRTTLPRSSERFTTNEIPACDGRGRL